MKKAFPDLDVRFLEDKESALVEISKMSVQERERLSLVTDLKLMESDIPIANAGLALVARARKSGVKRKALIYSSDSVKKLENLSAEEIKAIGDYEFITDFSSTAIQKSIQTNINKEQQRKKLSTE